MSDFKLKAFGARVIGGFLGLLAHLSFDLVDPLGLVLNLFLVHLVAPHAVRQVDVRGELRHALPVLQALLFQSVECGLQLADALC